jgi:hypothetical protein
MTRAAPSHSANRRKPTKPRGQSRSRRHCVNYWPNRGGRSASWTLPTCSRSSRRLPRALCGRREREHRSVTRAGTTHLGMRALRQAFVAQSFLTTADARRSTAWNGWASRDRPLWRWSDTRQNRRIGAMRSSAGRPWRMPASGSTLDSKSSAVVTFHDGENTSDSQLSRHGRNAHPQNADARRETIVGARRWTQAGVQLAT